MLSGAQIAAFNVSGFLMGIFTVWLYAAIRPRYGTGPKAAACAGAAVWALGYLLAGVAPMVLHILPRRLMAIGIAAGLIEVIVAALVGAWLYKEEAGNR
jgi:MFS family permease